MTEANFKPLFRFKIDISELPVSLFFDVKSSTMYAETQQGDKVKVELEPSLNLIVIRLLRSKHTTTSYHIKFKWQQKPKIVWAVVYIDMLHIEYLCSVNAVAPEILNMLLQKYGVTIQNKHDYTHHIILPFQNIVANHDNRKYLDKLNIIPYVYQLNNIDWLLSVESSVSNHQHFIEYARTNDLNQITGAFGTIYIDANTGILYSDTSIWSEPMNENRHIKYQLYGGVLCDEVGLGKTLSITSLILEDKYVSDTSASASSLILCPRRLVNQWVSEIKKYTNYLTVCEISTMSHVKKYSKSGTLDLSSFDIVISSFSLLDNKNYRNYHTQFSDIYWNRVVIDEGHEVLTTKLSPSLSRISDGIFKIKSNYRWICTGTPLPSAQQSLHAIISYLTLTNTNTGADFLENINKSEYAEFIQRVFHRNTRESVKTYITLPNVEEHCYFLDFTETERAIYDSIDNTDKLRKLQVCTNLNVSEVDNTIIGGMSLPLSEINRAMTEYYINIKNKQQQNIENTKCSIADMNRQTGKLGFSIEDKREKARLSSRIKSYGERLKKYQQDFNEAQRQVQIFRSIDIANSDTLCPITGKPLKNNLIAITPDGYSYSEEGIWLITQGQSFMCPYTRRKIDTSELMLVNPSKSKTSTSTDANTDIDVERLKWGTKLAFIIKKLRVLCENNRVIIFSQWDKMLTLIGTALKDCNILHVFCRGNVHCMSKSIKTFKEDTNVRVLLLSLESCSSGSNLTEASHVFLVDAVYGDREQALAIEEQAIGRVKRLGQTDTVHVHRFVIRGTIEEDQFNLMRKN